MYYHVISISALGTSEMSQLPSIPFPRKQPNVQYAIACYACAHMIVYFWSGPDMKPDMKYLYYSLQLLQQTILRH